MAVGDTLLHIGRRIQRCVMVTRPQPGEIDHDHNVLRTIARERAACLAIGAIATRPGIVRLGDEIRPADTQAA